MGILSALNTAVSGLDAQSDALGNISNNIAGSTTVGYKDLNTDFESLVLESSQSPVLGGVRAMTKQDVTTAGQLQTTGVSTDIAISGNGFLVVNTSAKTGAGTPLLTQAGSFRPDSSGNLVNAAGYYLQGQPLNEQGQTVNSSGTVVGAASSVAALSTVNISNISVASSPTANITFNANLPSSDSATAAAITTTAAAPPSSSVTYYDDLGTPQTLTMTFTPTATNTWGMSVTDSASTASIAAGTAVGTMSLPFDSTTGLLSTTTPPAATLGTYSATTGILTVTTADGQSIGINIGMPGSSSGMTQLDGSYTATKITSDGSSFGLMQSVSIGTDGVVTAAFSNGSTRPIYQLDIATVASPDNLAPVTGNAYSLSPQAGVPLLSTAGTGPAGTTVGGSLEGSNVDLATELTNMIVTQRAYGSSATVIQAANQMLQTLTTLNQ